MVSLEDAVIARYEKKGMHFEILVDPEVAEEFLDGKDVNLVENLASDMDQKVVVRRMRVADGTEWG